MRAAVFHAPGDIRIENVPDPKIQDPTDAIVRIPHGSVDKGLDIMGLFYANMTLRGGPAPVRAYMPELMEDVLAGTLDPSPIFDMTVDLDGVPGGYAAMDQRRALKVLVRL